MSVFPFGRFLPAQFCLIYALLLGGTSDVLADAQCSPAQAAARISLRLTAMISASDLKESYPELARAIRQMRDAVQKSNYGENLEKIDDLPNIPPRIRKALKLSRDLLMDKARLADYLETLMLDAAADMASRGNPQFIKMLEKGELYRNSVLRVLVHRYKARGIPMQPPIKEADLDGPRFGAFLSKGPFIDKGYFNNFHGADAHFLQLEFAMDTIIEAMHGDFRAFFDYFGTAEGRKAFAVAFDTFDDNPTNPDHLNLFLKRFLNAR